MLSNVQVQQLRAKQRTNVEFFLAVSSPVLFCFFFLFVSSKLCFLQHFFVQHSSQGLAKAERLTKLLHMQRYKHTRCVIPTAGAGFETVTS